MANAYVNQKKLDTETKILQANAAQFSRQTAQWLKLVEDFNTALKVRQLITMPFFLLNIVNWPIGFNMLTCGGTLGVNKLCADTKRFINRSISNRFCVSNFLWQYQ